MKNKNKKTENMKVYYNEYYQKNKAEISAKNKENYFNKKKKRGKCKMCGIELPKELSGNTKYCDRCLYSKGHGPDAHRMAAARWFRKKQLDKRKGNEYNMIKQ